MSSLAPSGLRKEHPPEKIDDRIIDLLSYDADLSYKDMAKRLRVNESTVRKRVLALRRKGVIRKFTVEVDPERLGLKLNVALALDVEPVKMIEVGKQLVAMPQLGMVYYTSGGHDFFTIVWTRDRTTLEHIIRDISAIDGVTKVTPSYMVDRLK